MRYTSYAINLNTNHYLFFILLICSSIFPNSLNAIELGQGDSVSTPAPSLRGRAGGEAVLFHMHIRLWEWNLDIILVESVVDALEDLAVVAIAGVNAYPDDDLEDEG